MPEIDRHLRGGLDEGALHEVKPERRQAGAVVSDWATALGFVLRLTVRRLHGLGISADRRLYVVRLDPRERKVIVGEVTDLDCVGARVEEVNWIAGRPPEEPTRMRVQVRHRHAAALARVEPGPGHTAEIRFEEPVRAVAPGQAAVFYDADHDEEVLGGGWLVEGIR